MSQAPRRTSPRDPLQGDSFGDRLREAVRRAGFTQAAFAEAMEVSLRTAKNWIAGTHDPPRAALVRMVEVLDVELEELLGLAAGQEPSFPTWAEFLATPEGATLGEEERRALGAFPWPPGVEPTVTSYRVMLTALRAATKTPEPTPPPDETWEGKKRPSLPTPTSGWHRRE